MHKLELASTIHNAHILNSALQVLSSGLMLSVWALAILLSQLNLVWLRLCVGARARVLCPHS
jgi:hypothetical protein